MNLIDKVRSALRKGKCVTYKTALCTKEEPWYCALAVDPRDGPCQACGGYAVGSFMLLLQLSGKSRPGNGITSLRIDGVAAPLLTEDRS